MLRTILTSCSTEVWRAAEHSITVFGSNAESGLSCSFKSTSLVWADSRATSSSASGAESPNVLISAITTSGRLSKIFRRHSAASPASPATSKSDSSSSKRLKPCRNRTWSCASKQRIFLPDIWFSICAGGTQFLLTYFGQRTCEVTQVTENGATSRTLKNRIVIVTIIRPVVHMKMKLRHLFGPCSRQLLSERTTEGRGIR